MCLMVGQKTGMREHSSRQHSITRDVDEGITINWYVFLYKKTV